MRKGFAQFALPDVLKTLAHSIVAGIEPRSLPIGWSGAGIVILGLLASTPAHAGPGGSDVLLSELSVAGDRSDLATASPFDFAFGVASPQGSAPSVIAQPVGEAVTRIERDGTITNRAATNIGSVLLNSPGVSVRQDNGGRDVVISIRGSNARSGRVSKNTMVLEDGFILTQPDGVLRFDLTDPRAYSRIDVFRGPQSALFGNYATGGAIAFRTRTGRELDGYEIGSDAGGFGYLNNYFTVGGVSGPVEISLFVSDARGNGYQDHASYDTQTLNLLASYTPTPDNRFTLKVIDNEIHADLPARSSLNQFRINPYQRGCAAAATAAPGCTLTTLFANGAFGRTVPVTADEGAFGRSDRRTIVAARWEHDIDALTTLRLQAGFDERNFNQPYYTTAVRGSYPSWNLLADLTRRYDLFGLPAVGYAALAYSTIDNHATTYNRTPYGGPRLGALVGDQSAIQSNLGGRARTEIALSDRWTGVAGLSAEATSIVGRNMFYRPSPTGTTTMTADADLEYFNVAPELALVYRPNSAWAFRGRAATGYSTPAASNLFVTAAGLPGNSAGLRTQENLGFDLGADWTPFESLRLSVTGFYEFFRNELVTQSNGGGRLSYTFNIPASEHRGLEAGAEWSFLPGWRAVATYAFNDQVYTRFVEPLSAGAFSRSFDRAGNRIPGVPANQLLARISYDVPAGPLTGLGAFVETVVQDGFFVDGANLLKVPGYGILNANVHYTTELTGGYAKRLSLYAELRNILDTTYVSSAQTLANTISSTTGRQNDANALAGTTGSIYAGTPRNIVCGLRLSF